VYVGLFASLAQLGTVGSVSVNEVNGVIVSLPNVMVPLEMFASVIPYPARVVALSAFPLIS
jgi:hypothetical protein